MRAQLYLAALRPLLASRYLVAEQHLRRVGKDCLISFEASLCSFLARLFRLSGWRRSGPGTARLPSTPCPVTAAACFPSMPARRFGAATRTTRRTGTGCPTVSPVPLCGRRRAPGPAPGQPGAAGTGARAGALGVLLASHPAALTPFFLAAARQRAGHLARRAARGRLSWCLFAGAAASPHALPHVSFLRGIPYFATWQPITPRRHVTRHLTDNNNGTTQSARYHHIPFHFLFALTLVKYKFLPSGRRRAASCPCHSSGACRYPCFFLRTRAGDFSAPRPATRSVGVFFGGTHAESLTRARVRPAASAPSRADRPASPVLSRGRAFRLSLSPPSPRSPPLFLLPLPSLLLLSLAPPPPPALRSAPPPLLLALSLSLPPSLSLSLPPPLSFLSLLSCPPLSPSPLPSPLSLPPPPSPFPPFFPSLPSLLSLFAPPPPPPPLPSPSLSPPSLSFPPPPPMAAAISGPPRRRGTAAARTRAIPPAAPGTDGATAPDPASASTAEGSLRPWTRHPRMAADIQDRPGRPVHGNPRAAGYGPRSGSTSAPGLRPPWPRGCPSQSRDRPSPHRTAGACRARGTRPWRAAGAYTGHQTFANRINTPRPRPHPMTRLAASSMTSPQHARTGGPTVPRASPPGRDTRTPGAAALGREASPAGDSVLLSSFLISSLPHTRPAPAAPCTCRSPSFTSHSRPWLPASSAGVCAAPWSRRTPAPSLRALYQSLYCLRLRFHP